MIRVLHGDCRDVLPTLEAGSVHTVVTSPPYYALRSYLDASHPDKHREIGSEATPDEYLQTMVAVFREVRRVLRDDGTCWVNMGDSYAGSAMKGAERPYAWSADGGTMRGGDRNGMGAIAGAKPKDLLMMPARLALALQADGWWIRSDIIWAKPNPMPESVTDRPTNAHEHVFLLTKQSRYYYDADAVRETSVSAHSSGNGYARPERLSLGGRGQDEPWQVQSHRNLRNVWTIATAPFPEAHFATFPPELAERCIKAGTSERGCCAACGAPWVRQIADGGYTASTSHHYAPAPNKGHLGMFGERAANMTRDGFVPNRQRIATTTGWSPGCQCDAPTQPCTVLDPFSGAGTTMLVADRLQRHAIGIELNEAYAAMSRARLTADAPLLVEVAD